MKRVYFIKGFSSIRQCFFQGLLILIVLSVMSCATYLPEARDMEGLPVPDAFSLYETTAPAPEQWWEAFDSEELNSLMEKALDDNLTLRQVYARLEQSQYLMQQANAALWPNVNLGSDTSITSRHNEDTGTTTTKDYDFGLSSSYEIDLWGRIRAHYQAASAEAETSREDLYAAMLSLSGAVARQWLAIAALEDELEMVQGQLRLNQTNLELMELRYRNGMATALDVYQQRQIVAGTKTLLPALESSLQTARHELAVLLGELPKADLSLQKTALPEVGETPDPGLPADLLARRPDIRAAGLQLQAADWRISAAQADRLPSLRLTANASYGAESFTDILDNWMASLAGSLTGPIFDAGRRKAEVERTRAVADQRLAAYQATILQAMKEVENALIQEQKGLELVEALEAEIAVVQATHDQALERYKKGLNTYLPVLSALTQLQQRERQLIVAKVFRLNRRIDLNIAIGGNWMETEASRGLE